MKKINLLLLLISFVGITVLMKSCKNLCKDVDCQNGGVCIEGDCDCPEGFTGIECECDNSKKTATLQLKFNLVFGDKPINLYEPVLDGNGQKVLLVDKFHFYISDLNLNGESVVDEILLIDLEGVTLTR